MARVVRPGGVVAVYVWDYGGRMDLMRYFWDAAVALDHGVKIAEGSYESVATNEKVVEAYLGLRAAETEGE